MARDEHRNRSDHPPYERGRKTHKADVRVNRGEPREPQPKPVERAPDDVETTRQEKMRDEHPTRMKATGRNPDRRNR